MGARATTCSPEPFEIQVADAELEDLHDRLRRTRYAEDFANADWRYGMQGHYLHELVQYWLEAFDWRSQERAMNAYPQYRVTIDDVPVHFVHIFNGDYLAVFLFFTGLVIIGISYKSLPALKSWFSPLLASTCASALVLVLLFAGWFELTFYEAWLGPARWLRFPLLLLLLLPWQFAEEVLLGPPASSPDLRRVAKAFALRAVVYAALFLGIQYLHSGAILLFLLLAYFIVFSVLQRLACDLVRFRTQSSAAAAIFGAILLAAFALAIFPIA